VKSLIPADVSRKSPSIITTLAMAPDASSMMALLNSRDHENDFFTDVE
jgi:hypothetical protein